MKRLTFVDLTEQGLQLTKEEALALQSHISKIAQHGDDGPNVIEFEKGSMYTAAKANELKTEQANNVARSTGFETAQNTGQEQIVQRKLTASSFKGEAGKAIKAEGYKVGDMYPRIETKEEAEQNEEDTEQREVTQADLDADPALVADGVKVGDVISFKKAE